MKKAEILEKIANHLAGFISAFIAYLFIISYCYSVGYISTYQVSQSLLEFSDVINICLSSSLHKFIIGLIAFSGFFYFMETRKNPMKVIVIMMLLACTLLVALTIITQYFPELEGHRESYKAEASGFWPWKRSVALYFIIIYFLMVWVPKLIPKESQLRPIYVCISLMALSLPYAAIFGVADGEGNQLKSRKVSILTEKGIIVLRGVTILSKGALGNDSKKQVLLIPTSEIKRITFSN